MKHLFYSLACIFFSETNLSAFLHQPKYQFYKEKRDLFPLHLLPKEIQNEIGKYLPLHKDQETDEEFHERLKKKSHRQSFDTSYWRGNLSFLVRGNPSFISEMWAGKKAKIIWRHPLKDDFKAGIQFVVPFVKLYTFSPDFSAMAIVIGYLDSLIDIIHYKEQLYIYDFKTKKQHSCIIKRKTKNGFLDENGQRVPIKKLGINVRSLKKDLWLEGCNDIMTMSRDKKVVIAHNNEINLYQITDIGIKKRNLLDKFYWTVRSDIRFNKQETKVGICYGFNIVKSWPISDISQKIQDNKNLLGNYLRQTGVCKNWPQLEN